MFMLCVEFFIYINFCFLGFDNYWFVFRWSYVLENEVSGRGFEM